MGKVKVYSQLEVKKIAKDIKANNHLAKCATDFINAYIACGHGCKNGAGEVILKSHGLKEKFVLTIDLIEPEHEKN